MSNLWIYTNYDCNLCCTYCLARSGPTVPRRAIGLANVQQLVDEAVALGFTELFFTGGEPTLLNEIYEMLAYASARMRTHLLTNAMLLRGPRLERLVAIRNANLTVQVSLDGANAAQHDPLRGEGSWAKTVEGIRLLKAHGFHVTLSTTETDANAGRMSDIRVFADSLGIAAADHLVRPLARRGSSMSGMELRMEEVVPEVTVNQEGVFWHPLSTDEDMQVANRMFPLAEAVETIRGQLDALASTGQMPKIQFR